MVLRGVAHIVGHHVHQVHVLDAGAKVDVVGIAHGGGRHQPLLAQHLAQVAHQQGEVLRVLRRGGYLGRALCGILPIDVDTVQAKLLHHPLAVSGKGHAVLLRGSHLAEAATAPPAHGQHHPQRGVLRLEAHNHAQAIGIVNAHAVECVIHVPEGIVDVGHRRGVGHLIGPRSHVGHDDSVVLLLLLPVCRQRQQHSGHEGHEFQVCFHIIFLNLKLSSPSFAAPCRPWPQHPRRGG